MWRTLLIAGLYWTASMTATAEDVDGVTDLTLDTWHDFLQPKDIVMVEFYAPGCGHCKQLEPEYTKAGEVLKKEGIFLAKVDASKEDQLANQHGIQGYPTLVVFQNGAKLEDYKGERTAKGIIEYMKKMADPNYEPPPSAIVSLTDQNFTKFVKHEKLSLVMWYAPKCPNCKEIMPEFEGAAQVLKEWGIPLIKVDGTTELELADQYGITGQPPMFKVFRQGRVYDYKGQQEKQNIVDYMRLQTKSPSEEKVHRMGIKNNMNHNEVVIVGFFAGKKSAMYNEYIVAANEMRGKFTFMHTFNEEAGKSFDMPMESVTVFMPELFWTKHENKTHVLAKKSATYKEIIAFIKTKSMPLVGWRHKRNEFKYSERPLIVIYYDVNYDQGSKDTQYIRNKIVNVAENFLGSNLKFAISNDAEYEAEIKTLGFQESGADVNVACYTKNQKFRMKISDEFESKDLAEFIEEFRTGKVKPYMKSLPVPETQDDPVLDIVADNYDTLVHKVKKDAVMFFHAPWCGHCREFDPIYEKIAKKRLDNNENIVFGKLDATSNDVPYMFKGIQGYPSIFFVRASDKFDPIPYKGDRSAESVRDWINEYKTSTGQAVDDDKEIESFTAENFEADVATGTGKKDEL